MIIKSSLLKMILLCGLLNTANVILGMNALVPTKNKIKPYVKKYSGSPYDSILATNDEYYLIPENGLVSDAVIEANSTTQFDTIPELFYGDFNTQNQSINLYNNLAKNKPSETIKLYPALTSAHIATITEYLNANVPVVLEVDCNQKKRFFLIKPYCSLEDIEDDSISEATQEAIRQSIFNQNVNKINNISNAPNVKSMPENKLPFLSALKYLGYGAILSLILTIIYKLPNILTHLSFLSQR